MRRRGSRAQGGSGQHVNRVQGPGPEGLEPYPGNQWNLYRVAPIGLCYLDLGLRYVYVNEWLAAVNGLSGSEHLGRAVRDMLPPHVVRGVEEQLRRVIKTGEPIEAEIVEAETPVHPGMMRLFQPNFYPVRSPDGTVVGVSCTVQDVTDRKYHDLYQHSPDMLLSVDMSTGRIIECNETTLVTLGYEREEFVGHPVTKFYHPRCLDRVRGVFEQFQKLGSVDGEELTVVKKGGSSLEVSLSVSAMRDEHSKPVLGRSSWRDITEQKAARRALEESRRQLRALTARVEHVREEERSEVARNLHDEIGQAMTAFKMDLAWLDADASSRDPAVGRRLQDMGDLIDSVIDAGRRIAARLRPGVLDDLGMVAAIHWQASDLESRTGLECRVDIEDDELDVDEKIATAVFRILQEALTNVIRHADASTVTIQLRSAEDGLMLRVEDDGRGAGDIERTRPPALGILGMKERARGLGGHVDFDSRSGQGTTVTLALPFH